MFQRSPLHLREGVANWRKRAADIVDETRPVRIKILTPPEAGTGFEFEFSPPPRWLQPMCGFRGTGQATPAAAFVRRAGGGRVPNFFKPLENWQFLNPWKIGRI